MNYTYGEEHGAIGYEYLDRGSELKEELLTKKLDTEEFDVELIRLLRYVYARIPTEYWDTRLKPRIARSVVTELTQYVQNASSMRKYGLGLTIVSERPVHKLQPLYVVTRQLVDAGFKCFVAAYDELVFWLREQRDNAILKTELRERFAVDFFFLVEIPDKDELTPTLQQDLLARLQVRSKRERPIILTVNSSLESLNDVLPNSFLGRLLLPFSNTNKPLIVEDLGDTDTLFKDKWRQLGGTTS